MLEGANQIKIVLQIYQTHPGSYLLDPKFIAGSIYTCIDETINLLLQLRKALAKQSQTDEHFSLDV